MEGRGRWKREEQQKTDVSNLVENTKGLSPKKLHFLGLGDKTQKLQIEPIPWRWGFGAYGRARELDWLVSRSVGAHGGYGWSLVLGVGGLED